MQIQVTGPTRVNSELSERDAYPGVRVCVCLWKDGGIGLKEISVPFVSTTMAPEAYDRDTSDERP